MSVLSVCQNAARLIGVEPPTQLVGSTNVNALRFLEAICASADQRRRQFEWPQLIKTCTIDLVSGTSTYSLPDDFLGVINETHFDVSNSRPMQGPLNSKEWAFLTYGITNVGPFMKYRIAGRTKKRFQVSPTPLSSGGQVAFFYLSKTWLLPAEWAASTTYVAGNYVSNIDGNIYIATTSGTSGSTEPTHTSGTGSDGVVTWQAFTDSYERPMFDTDEPLFDENLMKDDIIWMFRKLNGMDWEVFKADADMAWLLYYSREAGAPVLSLAGSDSDDFLIDYSNVPDTGFGL